MKNLIALLALCAVTSMGQTTNVSTNTVYEKTVYSWDYASSGFPTSLWGRVTNDFTDVGFAGVSVGVETPWGLTNVGTWGWIKTNLTDDLDLFAGVVFTSNTNTEFFVRMPEFITSEAYMTNIIPFGPPPPPPPPPSFPPTP